ncbi:hypothetical protein JCM30471_09230 [Desulfuromonas carbonis]|uniref:hypothetical protein n=1 Tax=Desulfuromonas sp. DDH964 TaxID=1823759 RepID=UPI00078B832B|nr:hypothetical protein [Desulfuromonas sp. DDH964]AMV72406.1 hypothetical protein DBW_2063 [Desulfuromonas sp. DDH964]
MIPRDRFDRILVVLLLVVLCSLGGLLVTQGQSGTAGAVAVDRNLERDLAARARLAFFEQTYAPVVSLQAAGNDQQALMKLEELGRRYPGEAHGDILRAASLLRLGALPEAVAAAVRAVRRNGDYVDRDSPFSQRQVIQQLVDVGLSSLAEKARLTPGNPTLGTALKNVYYLQSRLAGGCE